MHRQQMLEILFELREELKKATASDAEKQRMAALADEIERQVNDKNNQLSGDEYLTKKVAELIKEFESEHPAITNVLGRISDLLARIGL